MKSKQQHWNVIHYFFKIVFCILYFFKPDPRPATTNNEIVTGYGEFDGKKKTTSEAAVKFNLSTVGIFNCVNNNAEVPPSDSGSRFYVKSNGKFYLQGIVSSASSAHLTDDYNCTHNNFAMFADEKARDEFILKVRENC